MESRINDIHSFVSPIAHYCFRMTLFIFLLAAGTLPGAFAHYFFPHFIANGNFTEYFEYVREDTQGFMPLKNAYTSNDLRCNVGSQDFASQTGIYKVTAGDEIGFGTDFGAEILHPGPMQVYLSKAPGTVTEYDGSGDWFKVYELGPTQFGSDGIQWGATGKTNFTFTLPEETPAGQYLVRIEHIGVHGASEFGVAEFFFNCAQIEVESDSTATPGPLVKIPGIYTGYEPGILFNMYSPSIVNYTMPGPAQWPNPQVANIVASGVSVAPTVEPWTLPAVTEKTAATGLSTTSPSLLPLPSTSILFGNSTGTTQPSPTIDLDTPDATATNSNSRPSHCSRRVHTVMETITVTAT